MRDTERATHPVKAVAPWKYLRRLQGKWHAVVGQDGRHVVGQLLEHPAQEFSGPHARGRRVPFGEGHLAGAIEGHQEVLPPFFRVPLGNIDGQLAHGLVLDLLFSRRLPVLVPRQAADTVALDTVALKTAVQRRARQVREGLLPGVEAVVERQQRVLAESDGHDFFFRREHGGSGVGPPRRLGPGGRLRHLATVLELMP